MTIYPTRFSGPQLNRRRFIQQLMAAGAATSLGACGRFGDATSEATNVGVSGISAPAASMGSRLDDRAGSRVLVIIDLAGGNDGLNTLVPFGSGTYYDLRPQNAIPEGEMLELTDQLGVNENLARLHQRGFAYVSGVGPLDGNLSHFEMENRWARGDVNGGERQRDGFLGRVINTIADGSPLAGVSLSGATPHFFGSGQSSLSLTDPGALWFLEETDWEEALIFQEAMKAFEGEGLGSLVGTGYGVLDEVAGQLASLSDEYNEAVAKRFEGAGGLGNQLMTAGTLIDGGIDTTVFYAQQGGFDTHSSHRGNHDRLLNDLDGAIDAFLGWMDDIGRGDDVVVATISEFGRRVEENDSGLDHGNASTMLLAGAIKPGSYGEDSPLNDLDNDGNLRTTISFDRYLATLAEEWLGVEASSVLPNEPGTLGIW